MNKKPVLKLGFIDTFGTVPDFFISLLSEEFDIIRDDINPDYLFFCDENFGQQNHFFNDKNTIKIFFTGENRRYFNYACHFALTSDHDDNFRHFRFPGYATHLNYFMHNGTNKFHSIEELKKIKILNNSLKKYFCSFIVRNGQCSERNNMFHLLSKYKKIDSAGSLFNNMNYIVGPNVSDKINFLSERKFSLVYENSSYPGWVTEKLPDALMAGTIPIYWGSPTVALDFNTKAFISRHDFDSDEEMINRIIELDNDDDQYNEMLSQPMFTEPNKFLDLQRFVCWFKTNVYRGIINS